MVVPGSPSHTQLDDKHPKPTKLQSPHQPPPQSETLDFSNPPHSPIHDQIVLTSQQSDNHEDTLTIIDGNDQQSHQKEDQLSSKTHTTLPEPVVLANDTKNPLQSPTNYRGRTIKRKKGSGRKITKNKRVMKKIENLTDALNPIPFIPKALDLDKHEDVLKRLGLYDFTKIEFGPSIRTDLLIQLIVNFDSKKRCSYVNGKRINVSRADLARALQLPDMRSGRVEVDLDFFSDEAIGFIEDFVSNWVVLHEDSWDMPAEIVNWTSCIRDGHPRKLDSASLLWYKIERELAGDELGDCYYASHLLYLIRSQKPELFKEDEDDEGGGVDEAEECKKEVVEEEMEEQVNWKNSFSEPILQRCQSHDLNDFEEFMVENVEDEQIEQVEDEDVEVEIVEEEEGAGERFIEGFDMEANDNSMGRDGLTDNFHRVSNFDIFRPRDDSFMSHGGPSFFDNGGKRVMEPEEDMHRLDGNSKRLKTAEMFDHKQDEFGDCIERLQQWMEKAKMIQQSKEESLVNSQCHQNLAIGQLQERNQMMELVIKSRDEELKKKNAAMFRLERELYLMVDLLAGYRKALNDTRFKFKEYRRRVARQEEPLYKDAGPGGLVLSTRELEKQRLKQEECMMKFQTLVKGYEEEGVYQLNIQGERVSKMAEKLVFVGNEVKKLKEIATQRKATRKPRDELELSPEPEENPKSRDEVSENDASKELLLLMLMN